MRIDAMEAPRVKRIYLHLTRRCNLKCRYCYFGAGEPMADEWTIDNLRVALSEIVLMNPDVIIFTGGEPLLRTDLFEAVKELRRFTLGHGVKCCLISNGLLIDHNTARQIAATFDEVRISIDGPPGIMDVLRGKGSGQAAVRAILRLRSSGIVPAASVTVSNVTLPILSQCLSYILDDVGVCDIHLSPLRPVGRALDMEFIYPTNIAKAAAGFWRSRFGVSRNLEQAASSTLTTCGLCGIGEYLNILPDGSVYPCHMLSAPAFCLGNMREFPLSKLVRKSRLSQQLKKLNMTDLAGNDEDLRSAIKQLSCLGEIYHRWPGVFERQIGFH